MSKTIREHISNIQVEKSNLEHIAKTGEINGSLLISIEKAMRDYIQSQTQELQQQNEELVASVQLLLQSLDYDALGVMSELIIEDLKELLTKHNHLNKKP